MRPVGVADAQAWAAFLVAAQAHTYGPLAPEGFGERRLAEVDEAAEELTRLLADPAGWHGVLAERGGVVVAVAAAGPAPAPWEEDLGLVPPPTDTQLDKIYIDPTEHGTGLADRLLAAVLAPGPAYLWLIDGNERAERFYTRRGFVPLDEQIPAGESWGNIPMHRMVRA
ncbi:GNAT family N-acetyltransferase [Cellulomonas hominis]|nr:GNAT family N-acetyltransferase [Cellulomonas hominis]